MSDWISRYALGFHINDLNTGGFITRSGKAVCIDYGWGVPRGRS